jgi:hypothetical protein
MINSPIPDEYNNDFRRGYEQGYKTAWFEIVEMAKKKYVEEYYATGTVEGQDNETTNH